MVENNAPAMRMSLTSSSPEETRRIAAALGAKCHGGEIFLLYGDLGAGKTCFVQGLAEGLEVKPELRVTSPTFTIHAEYPGRLVLNHLDLYRLEEAVMLDGLGIEDMLADTAAVTAAEWPEMLEPMVGMARMDVRIDDAGEGRRTIELSAYGRRLSRLLTAAAG